jgi:hypothetical protein
MSRIPEIAAALTEAALDGWLFYDFRLSDPLAYRILGIPEKGITSRRWFFFIPAAGEPCAIVSAVEAHRLDALGFGAPHRLSIRARDDRGTRGNPRRTPADRDELLSRMRDPLRVAS